MRSVWLTVPMLAAAAFAQPSSGSAIAHTEGVVYLDGKRVPQGDSPVPIPDHAIISTEAGRAELQLSGGDTLFLWERGSVQVETYRPFNFNRLEMLGGPAVIVTGKMGSMLDCEEPVRLSGGGIFHLDLRSGRERVRAQGLPGRRRGANAQLHHGVDGGPEDGSRPAMWRYDLHGRIRCPEDRPARPVEPPADRILHRALR
jgi:hypothetical protein